MEVKISNISRLAAADSLRNIFTPLGEILHLDWYPSPQKKDGSYEADIIFANLSEARLAVELNRTELGDRMFTVEPIMNKFRFYSEPEPQIVHLSLSSDRAHETVKTILLRGLSLELTRAELQNALEVILGEKPVLVALYGKNIMRLSTDTDLNSDTAMAAVEMPSRSSMLKALLTLRAAPKERLDTIVAPDHKLQVDEAWKRIDPKIRRPHELLALSGSGSAAASTGSLRSSASSSMDIKERDGPKRQREHSRERDRHRRDRSRDGYRSRSRSRDRHHRRRSRSRSRRY